MYAASFAKEPIIIRLLLGAGADPDLVDESGKTAADYAEENTTKSVAVMFEGLKKNSASAPTEAGVTTTPTDAEAPANSESAATTATEAATEPTTEDKATDEATE
jgi:ankyrin repeat protein